MIFAPPRHGKSQLVSRELPAFIFGKHPNAKIITASYNDKLASRMNRDVQKIIDSDKYRELFPNTTLSGRKTKFVKQGSYVRNSSMFEIVGHQGSYLSAGVGCGITGSGFDFGIIDDPLKDRKEAESQTTRNAIWDWYDSTFCSRQDNPGGQESRIIIILTRWHEDDLAGRLLELQRTGGDHAEQWDVVSLPAILDCEPTEGDPREEGDILWPQKFNEQFLLRARTRGIYNFSALYQQRPQPAGGAKIKRDWFNVVDRAPEDLRWKRFWDLAVSAKKSADYTASIAGAKDSDGNVYLKDMIRGQWEWPQTEKTFTQTALLEKISVGIEEGGQQKGFIDGLKAKKELMCISIKGIRPDTDKLTRALPWISRAESGKVFLVRGSWINEFLNECQLFTGAGDKHDDQIDAVSGVYKMITDGAVLAISPITGQQRNAWK
jgi:predicted phage terminase large subunit-like protein